MNFVFSDEQQSFRRAVRKYLEKACPPEYVRGAGIPSTPTELWRGLAALGVAGLTVPEEYGGLGKDEVDLVLLLEEAGRAVLPEPLVDTLAVAVPAATDSDPSVLPGIAAGEVIARARSEHAGVMVDLSDGSTLTGDPDRAAFGAAATLCGIADRVIEMAAAYAKERRQFGAPIGSFQAVKHMLADALLGLTFARPAVYRAAWSLAREAPDRSRDVSMAKAVASDAGFGACRAALQTFGAIGYTHEHDLHLWLNRGFALCNAWGTAAWHRERVARAVLSPR